MMTDILVRPACLGDVFYLARHLRSSDVQEVMASHGLAPLAAVRSSFEESDAVWVAIVDGEMIAMFGVRSLNLLYRTGSPWLLGTDGIVHHYRHFLRGGRWWVQYLRQNYDVLVNAVDERNVLAKRWLSWLGFALGEAVPMGPHNMMFNPIELRGEACACQ